VGFVVGAAFGGCSQEQKDNWTWNPFEKKTKATPPDAGSKARPPVAATAGNQPRKEARPSPDDAKAEQVNQDVDTYAKNFPADRNAKSGRSSDPRTPAIDDDEQLADASSPSPRAQRTSARPSPTRTNDTARNDRRTPPPSVEPRRNSSSTPARSAPPQVTDSGNMSEELVLLPTGSTPAAPISTHSNEQYEPVTQTPATVSGTTSQQPIDSNPNSSNNSDYAEPTNVAMSNSNDSGMSSSAIQGSNNASSNDADIDEPIARPPVLGSIQVEAGNDSGSDSHMTRDSIEMDETNNTAKATPAPPPARPIEPIKTPTPPPAVKPANTEAITPIRSAPPAEPKPTIVEPKTKPVTAEVTPFEDGNEDSPEMTTEVVRSTPKPEITKPTPARETIKPAPVITNNTPRPAANDPNRPIEGTAQQIAALEAVVARQPNNIDQQLKLRMAYLLDGDEGRAITPTPGMSEDVERTVIAQIKSVIAAKQSEGRTAPAAANSQLASAETIRSSASEKADLLVPRVVLCTAIRAFGDYAPIDPATFPAGKKNKVLVYIEVDNFMSKQMPDGQYKTELSLRESLLDARGRELWSKQTPKIEDINRQPRRDFFVSTGARAIPASLPPGEYYYKVEIEDVQAAKVNSGKTQFRLVAVGKS